jgi:PAS domain S-box-containing protein
MRLPAVSPWWLSVRARLVAFAVLCAVPVLLLAALQMHRDNQHLHRHLVDDARLVAERLPVRTGLVLGAAESVAHAMGALDLTSAPAAPACSIALSRALAAAGPSVLNFTVTDPSGTVLCSANPVGGKVNVSDRPHFQRALAERRPVLSGLTLARVMGRQALLLAVPIVDADGAVTAVVSAVIDPQPLAESFRPDAAAPTVVAVFDPFGHLVSRVPAHPAVVSGSAHADSALFRHAVSGSVAPARVPGLDGVPREFVTRPVVYRGEPVLWVAVGSDMAALEAQAQAARWRDLAAVLLLAVAVGSLAYVATRPLVLARLRGLTDVASQVAQGRYDRRVPFRVRDELTPVEDALNQMLDAVESDRRILEASESRYRLLFEHSLDGVVLQTDEGVVLAANPAACRLLGRLESELKGMTREQLVVPGDTRLDALRRLRAQHGRARGELGLVRGDGSRIDVMAATSVYRDDDGRDLVCVVLHDITERKAAQEEAQRLHRELEHRVEQRTQQLQLANRELEAFTYSVSHDLRAPVAVVRSFAEVLEESGALQADKHRHYLRRIRAAGQHMTELIDGLLALAHISRSQLAWSVVDLSALARDVVQELAEAHPHRPPVEITPGLHAMGDARLLRVVLHNLLGNAMKFTGRTPGPRIRFLVADDPDGQPVFCVRDNGDGFDAAQSHRLFTAFQRLHTAADFPGLGIGLATVQRVIQRHGGRIWAEGEPGRGASFYFVLGAHDAAAMRSREGAALGPPA